MIISTRPVTILTILVTLFTLSFSQNAPDNYMLYSGQRSLQFKINDNFTLGSFLGSTIAYKYQLNKKQAFRFGFTLDAGTQKDDANNDHYINDVNFHLDDSNSKVTSLALNFTPQLMYFGKPNKTIYPYIGFGPSFIYSFSDSNNEEYDYYYETDNSLQKTWQKNSSVGVGAATVVGVEWFVLSNLSILAEYNSSIMYSVIKSKQHTDFDNGETIRAENKSTELIFHSNPVQLGISFYFNTTEGK